MSALGCAPRVPVVMAGAQIRPPAGLGDLGNCLWAAKFIVLPLRLEQTRAVVCPAMRSVIRIPVLQECFRVVCCSCSVTCLNASTAAVTLSYSLLGEATAPLRQFFRSWVSFR